MTRVLVLDDDQSIAELMRVVLEDAIIKPFDVDQIADAVRRMITS